jgi:hypothetical protein
VTTFPERYRLGFFQVFGRGIGKSIMFLLKGIHETLVFDVFCAEKNEKNNFQALKLKEGTFILLISVTDKRISTFSPWKSKIYIFL